MIFHAHRKLVHLLSLANMKSVAMTRHYWRIKMKEVKLESHNLANMAHLVRKAQ